jgi:hypothetical protein
LHAFVGWQSVPATHATQVPALHTLPVAHIVPFAMFPVSTHCEDPVEHEVVPVLHVFAGWQIDPELHETQLPPLQTLPVAHMVPFPTFPVSTH